MNDCPHTYFLSAERSAPEAIKARNERIMREQTVCEVLNHVPNLVLIIDENRQVVFANEAAARILDVSTPEILLGGRFGDVWGCVHATETPGGCGTSEACRYCGAANALIKGFEGASAVEECRLMVRRDGRDEAVDLRVWARPIVLGGETLLFFTADDIADEKRKGFLERIFLHDILNTASALKGFTNLMDMKGTSLSREDMIRRIALLSEQIVDEINAHRLLMSAENGELELDVQEVGSRRILDGVLKIYDRPETLEQRRIVVAPDSPDVVLQTDPTLLLRVVGNMAKNAIEASVPGETVVVGCREEGARIVFWVRNDAFMPENVRMQIFNRSFSTKGVGRGLGTYSMKFLTERCLRGTIGFTSTEAEGTIFVVSCPREFPKR